VRICHVAPELLPVPPLKGGAIERWIRDAAQRFAERGHEVHIVSRDHGDGARETCLDGVHYHFVPIPARLDRGARALFVRGVRYFTAVGRLLERVRPDIVHYHSRPAGAWLSAAFGGKFGGRAPRVISLHSLSYGWGFFYACWDRVLFRRAFRACARVLCVSDFVKARALEQYPELEAKTRTVYNGVDGRTFHPDSRTEPDGREPLILYVGRVEERKGVHVLLDAFERVISQRAPSARLKIVGPHSYWTEEPTAFYLAVADRCRTLSRVELHGPTYVDTELAALYRSATIGVVPSVFPEALGLTSLEAQASGVPVVVSNAGGLPETILPGESGLMFANGDADDLASSVIDLLGDGDRLHSMRENARAWAMRRFSWDRIVVELEEIYNQVLGCQVVG
jgi:spore coat protein SA